MLDLPDALPPFMPKTVEAFLDLEIILGTFELNSRETWNPFLKENNCWHQKNKSFYAPLIAKRVKNDALLG